MNEIARLAVFLAQHRPTRARPRHDSIGGWEVRFAQDEADLSWSFLLLGTAWSGPYPSFEEAEDRARRAVARHRGCTCTDPFTEDDFMCASCERAMLELQAQLDAGIVPEGVDWDEYARRRG